MMELYIETLTGAAFELRVSPFETILSVKNKIQRHEGIPISQQHLIWQSVELDDDFCLHDYDIHNGATLKLVLAMRGGPINTRRVPMEDSSYVEYMESTPEGEIADSLPGSRQVTLLVFREGDQLNFFRVVDRGDGTLTPLSESLSAASMCNLHEDEEDGAVASNRERLEENAKIKEKINHLRDKMQYMSVNKKTKQKSITPSLAPSAPSTSRPISNTRLQSLRASQIKSSQSLNKTPCLPPVSKQSIGLTQAPITSSYSIDSRIPQPPTDSKSASSDASQRLHHAYSGKLLPTRHLRRRDSDKHGGGEVTAVQSTIPENEIASSPDSNPGVPFPSSRRNKDRVKVADSDSGDERTNRVATGESRALSRQHENVLEGLKESLSSQRISLQSLNLSRTEAKMVTGLLHQAALEPIGSSSINSFSPVRQRRTGVSRLGGETGEYLDEPRSLSGVLSHHRHHNDPQPLTSSSAKLPPVKSKKKASKSKRCYVCTKKTGLATSYPCRCGNNFCASHRYAEAHDCTFDYKTEGRKLLEQSNPVVSAPKLPKI